MDELKLATADRLSIAFDDMGGAYHTMTAWLAPYDWDIHDIEDAVAEMMPAEQCYHSHDCCGHYYGNRGVVTHITHYKDDQHGRCQLVYVHRTYNQNV
jgi:hypothetical protein